ncbi:hypothetical protein [Spirosoma harenae]
MISTRQFILSLAILFIALTRAAQAQPVKPTNQPEAPFDSTTTLSARVKPASATVLQMFRDAGMSPTEHRLTQDEQEKVAAAFAALPPLHQRVLKSHLHSINFLDNMPNTALTSTVNPDEAHKLFDITFRAEILHQDASEWLTRKERTCFDTTGSAFQVSIQAGHLSAFLYVLLHESTHVVDGSLGISPDNTVVQNQSLSDSLATDFVKGIWAGHTTPATNYKSPLLDSLVFRRGGKPLPVSQYNRVYQALKQSPFVSLYGRSSWHEDLAEFVTVYHFTQKLGQPFTITVRKGNRELFTYKPMQSALVRKRFKHMARFYSV